MMRRTAAFFLLVLIAGGGAAPRAAGPPSARLDRWRVTGPGGGGTTAHPVISPHDPRVVVESCDMTGAYITHDAGASWRMFNLGTVASAYAFDPKAPSVIYAAASAIFRSRDTGRTWQMIWPDPLRRTERQNLGDHADTTYRTEDPTYPSGEDVLIDALAIDTRDAARLYAAVQFRKPGQPGGPAQAITRFLTSPDRGATWSAVADLPAERIFAIWTDASPDRVVRALGERGAYEMSSTAWHRLDAPRGVRFQSGSVGYDEASRSTVVYATAEVTLGFRGLAGGIFVSSDSGRTWRASNGGLASYLAAGSIWGRMRSAGGDAPVHVGPIGASARHGLTAYVGLRGLRSPVGRTAFVGVARTVDGGRHWTVVHRESDRPAPGFVGSWVEARAIEDGYSVSLEAPYDLAAAPTDPRICYVTDLFRTYRTLDGGGTWAQVHSAPAGPAWVSRGLDVTTHYGLSWDPFNPKRVFLASTDIGLFRSEDGGATWLGSSTGVPRAWRNTAYWVVADPSVEGLMWGGFSGTHDLPRPKMFRRTDPARFRGGVAVSTDGGRTWVPSSGGMAESAITHLLLDPRSPAGRRTLYAAAFGRGVYKSADNGRTWMLKNDGLSADPRQQPFAWRLTMDHAGVLYLVVARRSEDGRIGDRDDGAIYRSTDGAEHWTPLPLPRGTNGPAAVTVDPRDPARLYLSAWGVAGPSADTGGGVFVSGDAGRSWRPVLAAAQHVYDVSVDPRNPHVLFACGFDQGVYRSDDRGETWRRIKGFNFKWGHRVVPDPEDASRIYVVTFGGGVWHGPAEGDPSAIEDVVPPPAGPLR
jgi:hypothetical protein